MYFENYIDRQGSQVAEWLETKKAMEAPVSEQINKQFGKLEMACDELILRIRQIKNRQAEVLLRLNDTR